MIVTWLGPDMVSVVALGDRPLLQQTPEYRHLERGSLWRNFADN